MDLSYGAACFTGFNPQPTVGHRVGGENPEARVNEVRANLREATAHINPNLLPYMRLNALNPATDLPPHRALGNPESTTKVDTLIAAILDQALTFADRVIPCFTKDKLRAESKPSNATVCVSLLDRVEDKWTARTSQHVDAATPGTASWAEFTAGLKVSHCQKEMSYSPDIIGALKVCDWTINEGISGWTDVTCEVYEMVQKNTFPSSNRTYPLLVITASPAQRSHFIIVKIPVDLSQAPGALYSTGKNVDDQSLAGDLKKKTTVGGYVSVERVKLEESLPGYEDEKVAKDAPQIYWEMATASNSKAKGKDKGDIVKDVGSFIDWIGKNREVKASFDGAS